MNMEEEYTVDDWMELKQTHFALCDYLSGNEEDEYLINIEKAIKYIQGQLGIRTEPRVVSSLVTDIVYLTNIYTIGENGLITTYSKRVATAEEIEKYDR